MPQATVFPVGVVIERRQIDSPWQDHVWRPVSVVPGAPPVTEWKELLRGEGWAHYLAATLPLELHRKETAAYKHNLESGHPALYVVLRQQPEGDRPVEVHLVTASPYEAEAYLASGDEIVEPVAMPEPLAEWLAAFVEEHHVEEVFRKRQRDKINPDEHKFGKEPIFVTGQRLRQGPDGGA